MKNIIPILAIAITAAFAAQAGVLDISLDQSTLTGSSGSVLEFTGTLTNTTDSVLWLNGDDYNVLISDPTSYAFDDSPFYDNTPSGYLDANGTTGDIGLFNFTIFSSLAPGNYDGSFTVTGGAGTDSQDILGSVDFTVQVTAAGQQNTAPEPGALPLVAIGIGVLLARKRFGA
jgi:hypothetical protein